MMPASSNDRRKTISVAPSGENAPINKASPSVRFSDAAEGVISNKRRESLPAVIGNNNSTSSNNDGNVTSSVTPGKQQGKRSISGGGGHDVVLAYHFEGTPFSKKKRKKTPGLKVRENNDNQRLHPGDVVGSGRISHEMKRSRTTEDAISALNDTFNMGGNTADFHSALYATSIADANESMMSTGSKSVAESSTASSAVVDTMNMTTLSDTHEYTASSFILAAKDRNVLEERAKSLFIAEFKKMKEKSDSSTAVEVVAEATQTSDLQDLTLKSQNAAQILGGIHSDIMKPSYYSAEPTATLELEDLTLNLNGDLTQNATQSLGGLLSDIKKKQGAKSSYQEEDKEEEDDEIVEFKSHQKSRTPRKRDVSVMNKTAEEDDTNPVGFLEDSPVESESGMEEGKDLFTGSGNEFNGSLGNSPVVANVSSVAKASCGNNIVCPSPSFISGKKTRVSPVILKNMGGDMSTIHKLTASLKKEKKMSLPVLGTGNNPFHPRVRHSMDPPGVMNETPFSPEPEARSEVVDSPARNTRSAWKSPVADSPARNTRPSARKSPSRSPIPAAADSPARNTRSTMKSPVADSPALNTRSTRKNKSPSPAKSLFNESTRASKFSEPTEDLSSEYPFLSLGKVPSLKAADDLSYHSGEGIQTVVFNDLLGGDSGGIEFTSRQSARKKRRETAETADLADLLTELESSSDDKENSKSTPRASSVHTPKSIVHTPKSILNSSGKRLGKKSVGFGSPKVAEYNVESPAASMTPMRRKTDQERSVTDDGMDEMTTELEGDIAQLISRGSNPERMDPLNESYEKTEELESKLDVLLENKDEESVFSLPSVSVENSRDSSVDDMSIVEPTRTIALEGNLSSLADARQKGRNIPSETTETINIENTITSLVGKAGGGETVEDVTVPSLPDATKTIEFETSIGSLIRAGENKATNESIDLTQTIQLNPNLEDLLNEEESPRHLSDSIKFSREHVSGEDDTVSELGMRGMTSHELQNNQEVRRGLERIVESSPPVPVDLTLNEIMEKGGVTLGIFAKPGIDVFARAIDTASGASSMMLVRKESERIMSRIVEQIAEENKYDIDANYKALVENNEELIRTFQERLRATGDANGLKSQLKVALEGVNAFIEEEFNVWLCQVAEVYNEHLSSEILPVLQEEMATISDRAAIIDRNREQVALPMLIKSARRETKKNFLRTKAEVASCHDEVSELQAEVEEAERQLKKLESSQQKILQLSKSVARSHNLHCKEQDNSQAADSSYFKFFSVEKLHNWVLTSSSSSSLSLIFRGASSPYLTLSFSITDTLVVTLDAGMDQVPRSVQSFLSESRKKKFHPAVAGFLSNKMSLLCEDLKNIRMLSPSEIPSVIHFAELRTARIEEAAKEIDTILNRCKDSFLQLSDTLKHEYGFTAFIKNSSRKRDRLRVTLSIPDCYPFAPLEVHLQSSSNQFDTDSMNRKLRKIAKPGFGALTRVIDAVHALLG